ncbi:hypothetical protein IGK74_002469 [Enterococcus sp. AZ150]|uniref:DUF5388 domain-containing protein n=1 Tax=Enterococcus sp. AZ150 TaxID=2774866 RepID=UPI003F24BE9D
MGLVKSNKDKKKNSLSRGPSIQPQQQFTLDDLKTDTKKDIPKSNETIPEFIYEPKPTTLKIDTKLRDQINALSLIGYGDTQKEAVEIIINNMIEAMDVDEKRKFDLQYEVLEAKTIKQIKKK